MSDSKSSTLEKTIQAGDGLTIEYKSSFKYDINRFKSTGVKTQNKFVEKESRYHYYWERNRIK